MPYPSPRELLNTIAEEILAHPERVLWERDGTSARTADGRHVDPLHLEAVCWRPQGLLMKHIGHDAQFGRAVNSEVANDGKYLMGMCEILLENARPRPMEPAANVQELHMQFRLAAMMAT